MSGRGGAALPETATRAAPAEPGPGTAAGSCHLPTLSPPRLCHPETLSSPDTVTPWSCHPRVLSPLGLVTPPTLLPRYPSLSCPQLLPPPSPDNKSIQCRPWSCGMSSGGARGLSKPFHNKGDLCTTKAAKVAQAGDPRLSCLHTVRVYQPRISFVWGLSSEAPV